MSRTPKEEPVAFDFDFDEAMHRVAQTDPQEVTSLVSAHMRTDTIEGLVAAFEEAAHRTDDGEEYWTSRDLARLLAYTDYRNFLTIIEKAKVSCAGIGLDPADHFVDVTDMIIVGKGAKREIDNIHMDRYACYLTAQNGDPRKKPVGFAQTYYAIQTRRQELADQNGVDFGKLSEGQKRLYLRNQVTEENKRLASAARGAGVQTTTDFAIFQNKGIQGLYGGMGVREIQDYKGLGSKAKILDHMGSTELAANLFRITQTEEKLRNRGISRKEDANRAHYEVGQKVRQTMSELSGILPEDLPVAEDVKRLAAAERKQQKQRALAMPRQPQTKLPAPSPVAIDLREDLWKYALLIMSVRPNGEISTSDMIAEMPGYVHLSDEHTTANASRKDSKFSQLVRNLKSHKNTRTNFIYQGYAQDVRGGFKITRKGMDFVREYFKN